MGEGSAGPVCLWVTSCEQNCGTDHGQTRGPICGVGNLIDTGADQAPQMIAAQTGNVRLWAVQAETGRQSRWEKCDPQQKRNGIPFMTSFKCSVVIYVP